MIIIGFGQGTVALFSFTYGAKEYNLTTNIRKITNQIVFSVGLIVFVLVAIFSRNYSAVFVSSQAVRNMVSVGAIIFAVSFLFSGINTITSFYFTSIGKAKESAIISATRGLILLLICIFTLPALLGMNGVWLVAPITEMFTLFISLFFIKKKQAI